MTSGWSPQLARRNALQPSKSNRCVSTKSAVSGFIACGVGGGSDIASSADTAPQAPFNLLITRSLLLPSKQQPGGCGPVFVVARGRAFNVVQGTPAPLR